MTIMKKITLLIQNMRPIPDLQFAPTDPHRTPQTCGCLWAQAHLVQSARRNLGKFGDTNMLLTFLNMTKGSSILDRTFSVMLGGRPSVKAYLSMMLRPPADVHSPT